MSCCERHGPAVSRRSLLGAALGAGALATPVMSWAIAPGAHEAEALLLSCMDYRLMDAIGAWMTCQGLRDKYDHVVLAGAALGPTNDRYPDWAETFWTHLDLAVRLHEIKKVIVLDHMDCGAYKLILGTTPETEPAAHVRHLELIREMIVQRKGLPVQLALMNLDGTVRPIG